MNIICATAFLTVVVVSGQDANNALPGLRPNIRRTDYVDPKLKFDKWIRRAVRPDQYFALQHPCLDIPKEDSGTYPDLSAMPMRARLLPMGSGTLAYQRVGRVRV